MDISASVWENRKKLDFTVNGRESYIIVPDSPADGMPWVWRAEYFGAFDSVDRALLDMGWHLAYHKVTFMYGSDESTASMKDFHDTVCTEFGLAARAVILGFSMGGLIGFNYAYAHPEDVSALYLDAPALDLNIFRHNGEGWQKLLDNYKMTDDELTRAKLSPVDRAAAFAGFGVPVIIVAGLKDEAAVYEINSAPFVRDFSAAGGVIKTILKPDCGHHPHSLADPKPITDWLLANRI